MFNGLWGPGGEQGQRADGLRHEKAGMQHMGDDGRGGAMGMKLPSHDDYEDDDDDDDDDDDGGNDGEGEEGEV